MKEIIMPLTITVGIVSGQLPESKHFELEKSTDGVYAAMHKIGGHAMCNAGIIDIGDETIIFDTFLSPTAVQNLLKAVKK